MKLVIAIVAASSVAAAEPPADFVVADLGLHVIGVGEQHELSPRLAFQIDADYYAPWTQLLADSRGATDTFGAVLRARVMLYRDAAPTGWWLSPFVQGGVAWTKSAASREAAPAFAGGASIGYAWLFGKVHLAIGFGAQYHVVEDHEQAPGFHGVWPHGDIVVGRAL